MRPAARALRRWTTLAVVPLLLVAGARPQADGGAGGQSPGGRTGVSAVASGTRSGTAGGGLPPAALRGRQAPSQVRAERPVSVELPDRVVMAVDLAATAGDGALRLPTDIHRAGWWEGSSRIGDPFGAIVVAAHVDSFTQGLGPIAALLGARRGDPIGLAGRDLAQRFRVVSAGLVPRTSLAAGGGRFSPYGAPRLVLITCGGAYDAATRSYRYNLVVVAAPVTAPVVSPR